MYPSCSEAVRSKVSRTKALSIQATHFCASPSLTPSLHACTLSHCAQFDCSHDALHKEMEKNEETPGIPQKHEGFSNTWWHFQGSNCLPIVGLPLWLWRDPCHVVCKGFGPPWVKICYKTQHPTLFVAMDTTSTKTLLYIIEQSSMEAGLIIQKESVYKWWTWTWVAFTPVRGHSEMRGTEPVNVNQPVSDFVEEQWQQKVKRQSSTPVHSCTMIRRLVCTRLDVPVSSLHTPAELLSLYIINTNTHHKLSGPDQYMK